MDDVEVVIASDFFGPSSLRRISPGPHLRRLSRRRGSIRMLVLHGTREVRCARRNLECGTALGGQNTLMTSMMFICTGRPLRRVSVADQPRTIFERSTPTAPEGHSVSKTSPRSDLAQCTRAGDRAGLLYASVDGPSTTVQRDDREDLERPSTPVLHPTCLAQLIGRLQEFVDRRRGLSRPASPATFPCYVDDQVCLH